MKNAKLRVNRGLDVYTYVIHCPVAIKTLSQFLFYAVHCKNDQRKEVRKSRLCGTQKKRDEKSVNKIVVRKTEVKLLL
jgi:hypothetical protein